MTQDVTTQKKSVTDLTTGNPAKLLLLFSLPLMAGKREAAALHGCRYCVNKIRQIEVLHIAAKDREPKGNVPVIKIRYGT